MIIESLRIRYGFFERYIVFDSFQNLIFSSKNTVGKTTLVRLILHAMGYSIPSTKGLPFKDIESEMIINNGFRLIILRKNNFLKLSINNEDSFFSLPTDSTSLLRKVFNIDNDDIVNNLLGTFYVDQEKGWTLLNRGTVIGSIKFNIESYVRGLSNRDCTEATKRLEVVDRELRKYQHMSNTAEYQKQLNELSENVCFEQYNVEIRDKIDVIKFNLKPLKDELKRVDNTIRQNNNFKKYIQSMKLIVCNDEGVMIPVNEKTLVGYNDNFEYLLTKRSMVAEQIDGLERQVKHLEEKLSQEETLFDVNTVMHNYDYDISKIIIDERAVNNVIEKLKKESKDLKESITQLTKYNNDVVDDMHIIISNYAKELSISEEYVPANRDYIFTSDLKSLSGAVFYKIVFIFKLAYINEVKKKTGLILPIILDSPNGREVKPNTIKELIDIVKRDYSEHQIIVASIYKDNFEGAKVIEIKKRIFEDVD